MSDYLYHTILPVLLDGEEVAGRMAQTIWRRYGLTTHWFGRGHHLLLTTYTKKHKLPAPLSSVSDLLLLQILLDFAKEQTHGELLVLIPCSLRAKEFLSCKRDELDSSYVLLLSHLPTGDPLSFVVR